MKFLNRCRKLFATRARRMPHARLNLQILENRTLPAVFLVDRLDDVITTGTCLDGTSGDCTVRNAIEKANSTTGTDTIRMISSLPAGSVALVQQSTGLPIITENLNIEDRADSDTLPDFTIKRDPNIIQTYRIFTVGAGVSVTLSELIVSNGVASQGGGIHNSGNLTLNNCVLEDNVATATTAQVLYQGGAIFSARDMTSPSVVTIVGSTIENNEIFGQGAATDAVRYFGAGIVSAEGTELNVTNSKINNNVICSIASQCPGPNDPQQAKNTFFEGGGIYAERAKVTITNSDINENKVFPIDPGNAQFRGEGGGLRMVCGFINNCLDVDKSSISKNEIRLTGEVRDGGASKWINATKRAPAHRIQITQTWAPSSVSS